MRESKLERKLVSEIKRRGGQAVKWTAPGERGVPDRIVIMPHGKIYFVELKGEGGKVHPLQARWIGKLIKLGHKAQVVGSEQELDEFLQVVDLEQLVAFTFQNLDPGKAGDAE